MQSFGGQTSCIMGDEQMANEEISEDYRLLSE